MLATSQMQEMQETNDYKREIAVRELKTQWFNYSPSKRVQLTKAYPEIAEIILMLIEIK